MATVSEIIPEFLQPEGEAAFSWFNRAHADHAYGPPSLLSRSPIIPF